ncbi:MAG: hypothetical protein KKI02_10590, partial [Planctomycetes bacterium]|nr:hypothetical protein [Planctomycetota bacterium]
MRYGILLALGLSTLVVGATCLPIFDLDPPDDPATATLLAVSVIRPAEDHEVHTGDVVTIEWTAVNLTESDAIATVLVRHRDSSDETILAGGVRPPLEPDQATILWDTTGFDGGTYSIMAEISAGDRTAEATAEGRITLGTLPVFSFTGPTSDTELVREPDPNDPDGPLLSARVTISWTGFDPDGDGNVQLALDEDSSEDDPDHDSDNEVVIGESDLPETSDSDSLVWTGADTGGADVEAGTYNLYAVVSDGVGRAEIVEAGVRITVPEPIKTELTITKVDDIWRQPPLHDPNSAEPECFWGWGDLSEYDDPNRPIVADDWVGDDDRPISEIRWWGSYRGWDQTSAPDVLQSFHIGIWTATSADPSNPNSFGHPDELVWESWARQNEFTEEDVGCDYHSDLNSREVCFRYTYSIPESEWFHQDPNENVYWISISARYSSTLFQPEYQWGWQTRARDPNTDGAVRISGVDQNGAPTLGAQYDQGELITSLDSDVPWDLAFRLKVTETDGDIEFLPTDYPLTLEFTLDEDNDVFVDLRIDTDEDHVNGNEATILRRYLVEKGTNGDTYKWHGDDSEGDPVDDGIYRVFMAISRGSGSSQIVERDGLVLRRSEEEQPLIALLGPDSDQTIVGGVGGEVLITWRDDDPSESAKIRLTIDDDPTPNQGEAGDPNDAAEDVIPSADWDDLDPAGVGVED